MAPLNFCELLEATPPASPPYGSLKPPGWRGSGRGQVASRPGGTVLPLLGSWPLCSLGDSTAPAGVTGTQGWGLLSSQDPGRADHSALIPRGLPHSGWGLKHRGKFGVFGLDGGREEGPGVEREEPAPGVSSASPMAAETVSSQQGHPRVDRPQTCLPSSCLVFLWGLGLRVS